MLEDWVKRIATLIAASREHPALTGALRRRGIDHIAIRAKDNGNVILTTYKRRGGEGRNENSPPPEGWQPQADGVVL